MSTADEILANIISWPQGEQSIRALFLVGSRAQNQPVDDLADIDVGVYVETYEPYTQDDRWLWRGGQLWVYIPTHYYRGDDVVPTCLVIYGGGVKVDFAFLSIRVLAE